MASLRYSLWALFAALMRRWQVRGDRPAPYDPLTAQSLNWREEQARYRQERMW